MSKPEFVYTTYIETSAEKLWHALTTGDFTERYWFGHRVRLGLEAGLGVRFTKQGATTIEGNVLSRRSAEAAGLYLEPVFAGDASASASPASPSIWSRAARSSS